MIAPVRIGLPTFNRAASLERAIVSVLEQTWSDFELVISDNASTDETEAISRSWVKRDERVRYLRAAENRGPTANFNALFAECSQARYAMMLADDDWLDPDYVELCRAELEARPGHALVCGLARYVRDGAFVREGVEMQLQDDDAAARVRAYFEAVEDNGTFYGLVRGTALAAATPMPNVLGNDWLLVARLAFTGKVTTLRTTHVNRELDGTSADIETILRTFGAPTMQARVPHLFMARHVAADIGWGSPAYAPLGSQRVRLAMRCAWSAIDWPSLAWHVTAPTAASIGRRRRGHWVWRVYDRITRALGAGRSSD